MRKQLKSMFYKSAAEVAKEVLKADINGSSLPIEKLDETYNQFEKWVFKNINKK